LVAAFYRHIENQIAMEVEDRLKKSGPLKPSEIVRITDEKIASSFDKLEKLKNLKGFGDSFGVRLVRKYGKLVEDVRKRVFQNLPLSSGNSAKLKRMAGWLFVRDNFRLKRNSGLVFAGYGESEVFPSVTAYTVEGLIENKLRYRLLTEAKVGLKNSAFIMPFAQSEVVRGFLDGIDPEMEKLIRKFHGYVLSQYPIDLLSHIPDLSATKRKKLVAKLIAASQKSLQEFDKEFDRFQRKTLIDPVLATVDVLPKDELAAMAESLVNLTSFKRKFSMDTETVGGPIDVAVISKGDGFVWIKRKHYFTKDLNPHWLTNYYQDA
jgi:hypothetical protein